MKTLALLLLLFTAPILFAQYTYVPDDNFEQALIDQGLDDILDDYVLTSNISGVNSLSITDKNISDLTGIEDFAALSSLNCQYNDLVSLDLSQNSNLYTLYAFSNNLTQINILGCTNLMILDVSYNQLTTIDTSSNPILEEFCCYHNLLTNINVSNNTQLKCLECWHNSILTIDVSNNVALFNFSCSENQLTSIDLSNNLLLENFICFQNNLTSLNVGANSVLKIIKCYETQIESLDFSNNPFLFLVSCGFNDALHSLDMRNGNNTDIAYYNSLTTPNLTCIFVDDADYSAENWLNVDPGSTFVETQAACDELSLNEFETENFVIIPNPVKNSFQIKTNNKIHKISIYNILGKLIIEFPDQEFYDISTLSKGIFMLKIQSNKGVISKKLLIE